MSKRVQTRLKRSQYYKLMKWLDENKSKLENSNKHYDVIAKMAETDLGFLISPQTIGNTVRDIGIVVHTKLGRTKSTNNITIVNSIVALYKELSIEIPSDLQSLSDKLNGVNNS